MNENKKCGHSLLSTLACGNCEACLSNIKEIKAMLDFYESDALSQPIERITIESPVFGIIQADIKIKKNSVIIEFNEAMGKIELDEKTSNLLAQIIYHHSLKLKLKCES